MSKVQNGEEILPKVSTPWVGRSGRLTGNNPLNFGVDLTENGRMPNGAHFWLYIAYDILLICNKIRLIAPPYYMVNMHYMQYWGAAYGMLMKLSNGTLLSLADCTPLTVYGSVHAVVSATMQIWANSWMFSSCNSIPKMIFLCQGFQKWEPEHDTVTHRRTNVTERCTTVTMQRFFNHYIYRVGIINV